MKSFSSKLVLILTTTCLFLSFYAHKKTTNQANESPNNFAQPMPDAPMGIAVLELFTSEGCSSCPAADDILRGVAMQENVFALSFHVTYWNRLGWKDSFSQKIFDERQYNYNARFQKDGVYTPQLIVNGTEEFVGSRKNQVESNIKKALASPVRAQIELHKSLKDNDIIIQYKIKGDINNTHIHFAVVESQFATKVMRGENEGRLLKHDNVVRDFETHEALNTEGVHEVYPLKNWRVENCTLIVYLQEKKTGQITGAAKISLL